MPKVHYRKARKAYPNAGIEKGDMYYTCRIKTGPASGMTLRQKTPFKPSQLTQSGFRKAWLEMEDAWAESGKDADAIRAAAESIREAGEEARENFDNMPEGLQQGDTGQTLENRANECERIADDLETLADDLEGLDEPEEMEEPDEDDEAGQEAWEQWQEENDHYQSEIARIADESESLISDSPE